MIHAFFEYLALFSGFQYYRLIKRQYRNINLFAGQPFWIIVGCIFGAAIGNKALFWFENPQLFNRDYHWLTLLQISGQSMVGGLLGGLLGVEIAKLLLGVQTRTGDDFTYPILLGLIIGRIGCFLAGLSDGTYGNPTHLPWGYDFGDGIPRHPTQLYEIAFVIALWLWLKSQATRLAFVTGLRFRVMLCAYLLWRLLIDFIKPIPYEYFGGLSGIQVICFVALLFYLPNTVIRLRKLYA